MAITPPDQSSTISNSLTVRGLSASSAWDYENGFYWFAPPARLNKLLAHYDLYRCIADLPGDVFELGVYKAASLLRFAAFRGLVETECSRKIVGFDAFGKFPTDRLSGSSDLEFVRRFENAGGDGLSASEVQSILEAKGFGNVLLRPGDVVDTLPKYLTEFPATRLAMLHLDMDVKEPTEFALELLFDRVVPGGLIVIDDYGAVAGATEAVDTFISARRLKLEKLPYYTVPAFIRKP